MKNVKTSRNVSIREIARQFWNGIRPNSRMFFGGFALLLLPQIINVVVPLYYKKFFDILAKSSNYTADAPKLVRIVVIVLLLHVLVWLARRIGTLMYNVMQSRVLARLKQNAFGYMTKHSYSFFSNSFTGGLVQKVNRFSRAFESLTDNISYNLIPLMITVFGSIIVTFFIIPIVSLIMMSWVVIFTVFSIVFSTWKLKYDLASTEADSATSAYLADAITNNNAMSLFTAHDYELAGFTRVTLDQARKNLFSWQLGEIVDATQSFLIILVEFFVFYFAIKYWKAGSITVGTFVLAQTYIVGLANQLWNLNRIIRNIYQGVADSKEMVDILITPYEIKDAPDAKTLSISKGEINFKDVSFAFNDSTQVLSNINITVKPGEKIALIGPSGAGKTTFARLIMRLYDVTGGSIDIDGDDVRAVTQESLRGNISLVPQDPVLFHRTLMENIRYGSREATDEEVIAAARLAHCDEFIDKLSLKYETYVGERGIKLSGGERQRVAIARAILKRAPILIFDEATSSLDSYSESLIQDALENLMKSCTTIIIAHRLSTIKKMDRIISMSDGRIVEEGTHDELSNKESGLYKKLWDLQVGGFV